MAMTFNVSIQEELDRVNQEISALQRCKKVLEDTLAQGNTLTRVS